MADTSSATAIPRQAPHPADAPRKSTQYSPNGTALSSPINISPTSPNNTSQLPLQRHQGIYQPRTAIGVPAALRKTEKYFQKPPPKRDSGINFPASGWQAKGGLSKINTDGTAKPSSLVGNEDIESIYTDVPMSPTAGPITRVHWQNDRHVQLCQATACHEPFSFLLRRHHCRKCGGIFCWAHSIKQVRLDELARFHPDGAWYRACDRCDASFREWEHLRSSRTNSESSESSEAAGHDDASEPAKRPGNQRVGSIAQSAQGGWTWSTF